MHTCVHVTCVAAVGSDKVAAESSDKVAAISSDANVTCIEKASPL